jgi:hypothetical protein
VRCAGLHVAYRAERRVEKCRIFRGSFAENGRQAALRATQSPVACVRWVRYGT